MNIRWLVVLRGVLPYAGIDISMALVLIDFKFRKTSTRQSTDGRKLSALDRKVLDDLARKTCSLLPGMHAVRVRHGLCNQDSGHHTLHNA